MRNVQVFDAGIKLVILASFVFLTMQFVMQNAYAVQWANRSQDLKMYGEVDLGECDTTVVAEIFESQVSSPDPILQSSPIYYIEGAVTEVSLTLPSCIKVQNVQVNGDDIPEYYEGFIPIDSIPIYYYIVSDEPLPDDQHVVTVGIKIHKQKRGSSYPTKIIVGNNYRPNDPSGSFNLTIVDVKYVNPRDTYMSFSQAELNNRFNYGIFQDFSEDDELYSPGYNPLSIKPDGIHFNWQFKNKINNWCNPTFYVDGVFTLEPHVDEYDINNNGETDDYIIKVVWREGDDIVSGPDVRHDVAFHCDIVGSVLIYYHIALALAEEGIKDRIVNSLQKEFLEITDSFDCTNIDCNSVLAPSVFETYVDELRIKLFLPTSKVVVEVPYFGLSDANPVGHGFALNSGDEVLMLASGWLTVCAALDRGTWPCGIKTYIGPNGLPNYRLLSGQEGPINNLDRNPDILPLPFENPGAVAIGFVDTTPIDVLVPDNGVAEEGSSSTSNVRREVDLFKQSRAFAAKNTQYAHDDTSEHEVELKVIGNAGGVRVHPIGNGAWIRFGVNEKKYHRYGMGHFDVTVIWPPQISARSNPVNNELNNVVIPYKKSLPRNDYQYSTSSSLR